MSDVIIHWVGGNCPVQAEGKIFGRNFYFRARGTIWTIDIGEYGSDDYWEYKEIWSEEPFAAGWMEEDEAISMIHKAAELYEKQIIGQK